MSKTPVILNLGHEDLAKKLTQKLYGESGNLVHKTFPDGETYIRVNSNVRGREVIIVADLSHPNEKIVPLLLTALNCANMSARRIGLVAPYLPYMRQDQVFNPGEALSSRIFARLLNPAFDWLITVDPHLHRIKNLNEIFLLNPEVVRSAPKIAEWINQNIENPMIVGPDQETDRWVRRVAELCNAPFLFLQKHLQNDDMTKLSVPKNTSFKDHNIVIVHDIASTGETIKQSADAVAKYGGTVAKTICIHALFENRNKDHNDQADIDLISTNTIPHASNVIDVHELIVEAALEFYLRKTIPAIHRLV